MKSGEWCDFCEGIGLRVDKAVRGNYLRLSVFNKYGVRVEINVVYGPGDHRSDANKQRQLRAFAQQE